MFQSHFATVRFECIGENLCIPGFMVLTTRGRRGRRAITRKVLRGAVHVVATGQGWRKNCVGTWGVRQERVSVVENGTDLLDLLERDHLHSFEKIDDAPKRTGIVYLGGFYSWHGIDKLLAAAAQLVKRGTEITVTLIGSGPSS